VTAERTMGIRIPAQHRAEKRGGGSSPPNGVRLTWA
jgi:hypothetical protein